MAETRRFKNGDLITRDEAERSGIPWWEVMLYTDPVQQHDHLPSAEVDSDGMYEPRCEKCDLFTQPAIADVMKRWPTRDEAVAAASAVIAMLGREQ